MAVVPNPREIHLQLKVPYRVAHNVWRVLRTAAFGNIRVSVALERALELLNGHGGFDASCDVKRLEFSRSGGEWSGDEERIGSYIEVHDSYEATLVWLDDQAYKQYDHKRKRYVWVEEGFYVSSFGAELEAWEEWQTQNETDEDIEARGPSDAWPDIWTENGVDFYLFRRGMAHGLGADKLAFSVARHALPERLERQIEAAAELAERLEDEQETLRESGKWTWDQMGAYAQWIKAANARLKALTDRQRELDDPWDGSYDALQECDRMGTWWGIHRGQEKLGVFANVWFKRRLGSRDHEWKLLRAPKNYRYWQRAQEWRKRYRTRAEAVVAQKQAIGATPERGDLWTDHLFARAPWGIALYLVGYGGQAHHHVARSVVAAGKGWAAIAGIIRDESARQGRPVCLWSATPNSDPLSWALVKVDERPLSGLFTGDRRAGVRRPGRRASSRSVRRTGGALAGTRGVFVVGSKVKINAKHPMYALVLPRVLKGILRVAEIDPGSNALILESLDGRSQVFAQPEWVDRA